MNQRGLATRLQKSQGLTKRQSEQVVGALVTFIKEELRGGRKVRIRNFGTFFTKKYLGPDSDSRGNRIIYGLEGESVSSRRLADKLDELLPPLLGQNERLLKIMNLEKLNQAIKDLILFKVT